MRLGSLCTGFGGLDLAVGALLPVRHAWHAEVDAAASKVLAAHWPGVPNLGDITVTDWEAVAGRRADRRHPVPGLVDVLTGGIPCQGWSTAGKRLGSDDDRDLWPVRKHEPDGRVRRGAVDAIRVLRPRLFVLENVANLVSFDQGRAFAVVLQDLDELGYAVSWTTVGACRVGACHHRHRVFLAATTVPVGPPDGALFGTPLVAVGKWPQAGFVRDGLVWELPANVCGAGDGAVLPTSTAVTYGSNQSPSPGAAVRPSLEGVVQMLPTPTARLGDQRRGEPSADLAERRMESGRRNIEDAVALLPTPTVADSRGSRNATAGRRDAAAFEPGWTLSDVVYAGRIGDNALLPTPTARDATRGAGWGDQSGRPLSEVIALLPTPTAADGTSGPGHATTAQGSPDLRTTVSLLPTPRASDAAKGGPNQRGSSGDVMLPAAVQPGRFGAYAAAVQRQEQAFGLPAPDPTEPGRLGKPRLAPAFPEWMMGLPAGWICDHVGRSDAIRIAGNGVVWQAAAHALAGLPTFQAVAARAGGLVPAGGAA